MRIFKSGVFAAVCVLASGLLLHTFPVYANAALEGTCGDAVVWSLDDAGTLTVSGTGEMADYNNATPAPSVMQMPCIFCEARIHEGSGLLMIRLSMPFLLCQFTNGLLDGRLFWRR